MKELNAEEIETMVKLMTHEEIRTFRELLREYNNPHYLLRILYYDYCRQEWI